MTRAGRAPAAAAFALLVGCGAAVDVPERAADGRSASGSTSIDSKEACLAGEVRTVLAIPNDPRFLSPFVEGVAVANDGSIYAAEACTGDVYRIRKGTKSIIATIPYGMENDFFCSNAFTLGLAAHGADVWVVVVSSGLGPAGPGPAHGVWRIHQNGKLELAVPLSPIDAPIPNALAFDPDGNLYITETAMGAVWKVPPVGAATVWVRHDLLAPLTGIGANGIAYLNGALIVVNTDRGTLVKVPVRPDGSPGTPVVIATGFNGPDGVTVGPDDILYLVTAFGAQLIRIGPEGTPEIVLDLAAAGVAFPTSVDFGKSDKEKNTAYIANANPNPGEPSLVSVDLCGRDE
jgi:sugar lactone lactonase YvrE